MSSPAQQELRVAAEPENLSRIGDFIARCCNEWRVEDMEAFRLQLAVDEAAMNVIEHAYEGKGGDLRVVCWVDEHDFCVALQDHGRQFRVEDVPEPKLTGNLEERESGGLGLHFMQQIMDEVVFQFDQDGNRLSMIKRDVVP